MSERKHPIFLHVYISDSVMSPHTLTPMPDARLSTLNTTKGIALSFEGRRALLPVAHEFVRLH